MLVCNLSYSSASKVEYSPLYFLLHLNLTILVYDGHSCFLIPNYSQKAQSLYYGLSHNFSATSDPLNGHVAYHQPRSNNSSPFLHNQRTHMHPSDTFCAYFPHFYNQKVSINFLATNQISI
jgi:hypothetical protein